MMGAPDLDPLTGAAFDFEAREAWLATIAASQALGLAREALATANPLLQDTGLRLLLASPERESARALLLQAYAQAREAGPRGSLLYFDCLEQRGAASPWQFGLLAALASLDGVADAYLQSWQTFIDLHARSLRDLLGSAKPAMIRQGLKAMVQLSADFCADALLPLLEHADARIRREAALTAAQLGIFAAIPRLRGWLEQPDQAHVGLEALARLGDASALQLLLNPDCPLKQRAYDAALRPFSGLLAAPLSGLLQAGAPVPQRLLLRLADERLVTDLLAEPALTPCLSEQLQTGLPKLVSKSSRPEALRAGWRLLLGGRRLQPCQGALYGLLSCEYAGQAAWLCWAPHRVELYRQDGERLHALDIAQPLLRLCLPSPAAQTAFCVLWSESGHRLARLDLASGQLDLTQQIWTALPAGGILALAAGPDGRLLYASDATRVYVLNAETHQTLERLDSPCGAISWLAADAFRLYAGSREGGLAIWETGDWQAREGLRAGPWQEASCQLQGDWLLNGGSQGRGFYLLETPDLKPLRSLPLGWDTACLSPDRRWFWGSQGKKLQLLRSRDWKAQAALPLNAPLLRLLCNANWLAWQERDSYELVLKPLDVLQA